MTNKVYRTARGKTVDLGALELQNEDVRAVGNMNVNARGDRIDPQGSVVQSKNSRVAQVYDDQVANVHDAPVPTSSKRKKTSGGGVEAVRTEQMPIKTSTQVKEETIEPPKVEVSEDPTITPPKPQLGGLAAAIAASKSIKQEPMKTPRQESREISGVKKI